jgi:ribosome-binding factor A
MSKLDRVESTALRTLSEIYLTEVKDKAIGFMTITEVRITNDYSYLTIYYTVLGDEHDKARAEEALNRSMKFVRSRFASKMNLRKVPEFRFKYDASLDYGNKIEQGLKEVLKDSEKE